MAAATSCAMRMSGSCVAGRGVSLQSTSIGAGISLRAPSHSMSIDFSLSHRYDERSPRSMCSSTVVAAAGELGAGGREGIGGGGTEADEGIPGSGG